MAFPIRLMGSAARKLPLRFPYARRGSQQMRTLRSQEDRWIYWKVFALSGALTVAIIESLVVYADEESPMHKRLANMLIEAKSKMPRGNHGQSSSSAPSGAKES